VRWLHMFTSKKTGRLEGHDLPELERSRTEKEQEKKGEWCVREGRTLDPRSWYLSASGGRARSKGPSGRGWGREVEEYFYGMTGRKRCRPGYQGGSEWRRRKANHGYENCRQLVQKASNSSFASEVGRPV